MPKDKVYPHDDAETILVNLENSTADDIDVYIGPENDSYGFEASPFMNPFNKAKKGYDGAIEHYKPYFFRRYLTEARFREETQNLRGNTLGGWCYPRPCHGEVIIDILESYSDGGHGAVLEHIENELDEINKDELGVKGFREYEAARDALDNAKKQRDDV